jgi:hypothetical protein
MWDICLYRGELFIYDYNLKNNLYCYIEKDEFNDETAIIPVERIDNTTSNTEKENTNSCSYETFILINKNEIKKLIDFASEIEEQNSKLEITIENNANNINKPLKGGEILLKALDKALKIEFVN